MKSKMKNKMKSKMKSLKFGLASVAVTVAMWLASGCGSGNGNAGVQSLPVLDIGQAMENSTPVKMSRYFSDIEYIPLETSADVLVTDVSMTNIFPSDDRIYISSTRRAGASDVYSFDYTGKNLPFKAKSGRAEGEYTQGLNLVPDGDNVYMIDWTSVLKYDKEGNYLNSFPLDGNGFKFLGRYAYINGEFIYIMEDAEKGEDIITIQDSNYNVRLQKSLGKFKMETYMRDVTGDGSMTPIMARSTNPMIYQNNDKAMLLGYGDTLYSINPADGTLVQEYLLQYGKYHRNEDCVEVRAFFVETPQFVLYRAVFSKTGYPNLEVKDRVALCLYDKSTGKSTRLPVNEEYMSGTPYKACGFDNDLDGGMLFHPICIRGDKMYQLVNAYEFIERAESTGSKAMQEVAAKLNEDSNPVLVVATLK